MPGFQYLEKTFSNLAFVELAKQSIQKEPLVDKSVVIIPIIVVGKFAEIVRLDIVRYGYPLDF